MHLDDVLALHGDSSIDFLIPSIGPEGLRVPLVPMSYAEGLYFLRKYIALPWKKQPLDIGTSPSSYTIHGLKSTMISWATQLDLSDEHKRLQGKHQSRNSSTRLYSRDDVHGALKLQTEVIRAVQRGWRPVTPLSRGGQKPLEEPVFQLEQFDKAAPEQIWKYLQFNSTSFAVPEQGPAIVQEDIDEVIASSSSTSVSSSEDSSDSDVQNVSAKKHSNIADEVADEATGALHRNTWHIMHSRVFRGQTELVRTACGRHFGMDQISAIDDLTLSRRQTLCGHPGCRKGWIAIGAQSS